MQSVGEGEREGERMTMVAVVAAVCTGGVNNNLTRISKQFWYLYTNIVS